MTGSWWTSAERVEVPAGRVARGAARLPPSKSLTHRAYAVALLSTRPVTVEGPLDAEDTRYFLRALEKLDYGVEVREASVTVRPAVRPPESAELFCGNAGTLLRFLVALVAALPGRWTLDGLPRLRERPIGPLAQALATLGVGIEWLGSAGFAPLVVHGGGLRGGRVRLDAGESSQYLSALLLAGQRASAELEIEVPRLVSSPYVDLTEDLIVRQGGRVERRQEGVWVTSPSELLGGTIRIEPDLSAAAYPAAAAALTGGDLLLEGVALDSKQGDVRFLRLLAEMGAEVAAEPGGVRVRGRGLTALDADLSALPDQVPTLAALAPFARGTTRISNVAHLRLKESDRLAAMTSELTRAGARVEERPDGLELHGVWADAAPPAEPVTVDPHDDHRIAMAMALVGLRRPRLAIRHPHAVAKSWPGFWSELAGWLGERIEEGTP
jgi:3-phosphoshikimate 1-carboxyvinyltransferase